MDIPYWRIISRYLYSYLDYRGCELWDRKPITYLNFLNYQKEDLGNLGFKKLLLMLGSKTETTTGYSITFCLWQCYLVLFISYHSVLYLHTLAFWCRYTMYLYYTITNYTVIQNLNSSSKATQYLKLLQYLHIHNTYTYNITCTQSNKI